MIFDTDVLIWYFRGNQKAREFLARVPYRSRRVSSLCIMELVQGCRDRQELRAIKEFIRENIAGTIHPDERISERAIALLEGHAAADGLRTVDALVAATALQEEETLVTANQKHFKKITGLNLQRFEPLVRGT
jgi:predicted nucleic acid-binding protein